MNRNILRSNVSAAALMLALAMPAAAQTFDVTPPQVPLNDVDCNFDTVSPSTQVPPCRVDGSRSVTYQGRERQVRNATSDFLIDRYSVAFAGILLVDGRPVATGPGATYPFGNPFGGGSGPVDASYFFNTAGQTVNLSATYTGEQVQVVGTGVAGAPAQTSPGYFSRATNLTTTVTSIAIDLDSYVVTTSGRGYNYQLSSIDPNAIIANGTAVSGRFQSDDDDSSIQFGTLSGRAVVVPGQRVTPYPSDVGANNTGLLSNFQLDYDVVAVVTTELDENGLRTPRITVSDGIEMNGSRVTGLGDGIDANDAVNRGQLDAEALARSTADSALQANIDAEALARASGDAILQANIDAEAAARASGDAALGSAIAAETAARTAGDAALGSAIAAETAARTAGDTALATAIAGETTARTSADAALNTALAAEVVARQGADTQIVAALNTEVTTRQQADLQLSQRIAVQETAASTLTANLAAEQAARLAADNATAARLSSLDGRIGDLEARMDGFDDRVAGATAVATAMSGNAFLPDMRFNLTANVATYDGAHAGALQIGAMVTPNVAVNAGVATGFNRGGKTAARAGVTVGF